MKIAMGMFLTAASFTLALRRGPGRRGGDARRLNASAPFSHPRPDAAEPPRQRGFLMTW